jgi:hypothetical protein
MFDNRNYVIFNVSEIHKIDFNEVMETSAETVRKSNNGQKTFVKWDGSMPNCVSNLTTKEGPYSYQEMYDILDNPEWHANIAKLI